MTTGMIISNMALSIVFAAVAFFMIIAAIFSFSGCRKADTKAGSVFAGCAIFAALCIAETWRMGDEGGWMWIVAVFAIGGIVWLYKTALEE